MKMVRLKLNTLLYSVTIGSLLCSSLYILGVISRQSDDLQDPDQLYEFNKRLSMVEKGVHENKAAVKQVEGELTKLLESGKIGALKSIGGTKFGDKALGIVAELDCQITRPHKKTSDLLMKNVYREIPFQNQDGGVWKQGWEVTYDQVRSRWDKGNKLKVFVVPHSHNDPGWIKTFEKYYEDQTRHIFNNMVKKLAEDGSRKFIWAEISYLFLFWNEITKETQKELLRLVDRKQLEIVTGGWVMNDEANAHYYAIIEQLAAGHEWMMNNLNVKPKSGWSIDPFGLSPTMAYLLKRMGFDQMVVQRAHYEVKKAFAWNKTLEFRWRQAWDPEDTTEILTQLMPFYSYDIPHTCGPDPKVCCQFDFRRMRGSGMSCPWRVPPIPITPENVDQRAQILLDQYRKKSTLYKTNALLVPLGDDFRYNTEEEWDNQYKNYKRLFEYMNAQEDWHVEAQFGTLADYFEEVRRESARLSPIGESDTSQFFPSFSGDFFTYADERDHYWSGYYTSRPFYKNMDRVLEHYLRSADILFSMMGTQMESVGFQNREWTNELMELLTTGRRNLSLFQHHDGITGTSKDHVVNDYGNKLFSSIRAVKSVISQASHFLLSSEQSQYKPDIHEIHFHVDGDDQRYNTAARDHLIHMEEKGNLVRVVFFNSLPRSREEVVTLQVSRHEVKILDQHRKPIRFQISPQFSDRAELSSSAFDVSFLVEVPVLGLTTYYISTLEENEEQDMSYCSVAKIRVVGADIIPYSVDPFSDVKAVDTIEPFSLKNRYISAKFDENGLLQSVKTLLDNVESKVVLGFAHYGVRQSQPTSGAYLFIPDGPGTGIDLKNPLIRVVQGVLVSWVQVQFDEGVHEVRIVDSPGVDGIGLDITNTVDITQRYNFELAMRLSTDINSANVFYTDLNGFQMIRRERLAKLPLQANVFPMPAMAYIEDERTRLTLISAQPLGVSSQKSGQLEVMLDRRLGQDDSRGVGQGVTDNIKFTPLRFRLLVEMKKKECQEFDRERMDSYPSISAHLASQSLFYPVVKMASPGAVTKTIAEHSFKRFKTQMAPSQNDLPCDFHLLHLRTATERGPGEKEANLPSKNVALTIHRLGFDCCFKAVGLKCGTNGGKFSVVDIFPDQFSDSVQQMSLTLLHPGEELQKSSVMTLKPMELYTFLLRK